MKMLNEDALSQTDEAVEIDYERQKVRSSNRRTIVLTVIGSSLVILQDLRWPWTPIRWIGLGLWICSEVFWVLARLRLGSSFTRKAEARELVTNGIYARIQNPIYVFGGLTIVGLILYLGRPWLLLIFLVLIPIQIRRIRQERKVLAEAFGERYFTYRSQTWF
jgi:protein-S-isoprenylcysteine O-methyltransferase Ste14